MQQALPGVDHVSNDRDESLREVDHMVRLIGVPVWRFFSDLEERRNGPIEQLPWPMRAGVNAAGLATGVAVLTVILSGLDLTGHLDGGRVVLIIPMSVVLTAMVTFYFGISPSSAACLIVIVYGAGAAVGLAVATLKVHGFAGVVMAAGAWLVGLLSRPATGQASKFVRTEVADLHAWLSGGRVSQVGDPRPTRHQSASGSSQCTSRRGPTRRGRFR